MQSVLETISLPAFYLPLLLWMVVEAIWNLFQRDLPVWFSAIPLVAGLVHVHYSDQTWLAIILIFAVATTEIRSRWLRLSGTAISTPLIALVSPAYLPLAAGWLLLVLCWETRLLYGADALAGLILLIFFPTWRMLACIGLGLSLWAVIVLALRHRHTLGLRLWTVAANRTRGTAYPGIGGFVLALAAYPILYR